MLLGRAIVSDSLAETWGYLFSPPTLAFLLFARYRVEIAPYDSLLPPFLILLNHFPAFSRRGGGGGEFELLGEWARERWETLSIFPNFQGIDDPHPMQALRVVAGDSLILSCQYEPITMIK